ncbi:MAG: hypothetical protein ABSH25_15690 [Syntrophorhabdales bacterium]
MKRRNAFQDETKEYFSYLQVFKGNELREMMIADRKVECIWRRRQGLLPTLPCNVVLSRLMGRSSLTPPNFNAS